MSLFEDNRYLYRDTLFVLFPRENRPTLGRVQALLEKLGGKYELANPKETQGRFESATLFSPQDFSAMDVVYMEGEEVREQVSEIIRDFRTITLMGGDREKLKLLETCDARLDVFHFAEIGEGDDEDDDILDPGGLLLFLERMAELTAGVSYDPQSQALL